MPLYKYVTASTAERILGGSIRFTQPGAFNDPFELLPQFHTPEGFAPADGILNINYTERRRKGLDKRRIKDQQKYYSDVQARSIVDSLNSAIGILCLSRNPDSLLMWAHYADEYRGAVIEFDESHDFFHGSIPIAYRKQRPIYSITDFYGVDFSIADLCVKPNVWAYEKEVRVVRPLDRCDSSDTSFNGHPLMTMSIPMDCIKGVILGERMPVEAQRRIWSLVKKEKAALSLAAVANWGYAFRKEVIKNYGETPEGNPIITPRTARIFKDEPGEVGEIARWVEANHPMSEFVNMKV